MNVYWFQSNAKHLQQLAVLLLIVGSAWYWAQLTWWLATPKNQPKDIAATSLSDLTIQRLKDPIPVLLANPLFPQEKVVEAPSDEPIDAPKTRLSLSLKGVFSTGDDGGLAIIAQSGRGSGEVYAVGDSIPGGATLNAVYPDRVILQTSKGLETLPLEEIQLSGFSLNANATQAAYDPTSDFVASGTTGEKLSQYRDQFKRNPGRLFRMVNAKPYADPSTGKTIGFKLDIKTNDPFFSELGLQQGDVVTEVNGLKLTHNTQAIQSLRKLIKAKEANITLLRAGQEVTMTHVFE